MGELAQKLQGELVGVALLLRQLQEGIGGGSPAQLRLLLDFAHAREPVGLAGRPRSTSPVGVGTIGDAGVRFDEALVDFFQSATLDKLRAVAYYAQRDSLEDIKVAEFAAMLEAPWTAVQTVVHLYLLKELLSNFTVIQLLFQVLPDTRDVQQQQQTLEQLHVLISHVQHDSLQRMHREVSTAPPQDRLPLLEKLLALRTEYYHLYSPLLAFLSLSYDDAVLLKNSLQRMVPVQMLQVVQLRQLSPFETMELQSLVLQRVSAPSDILSSASMLAPAQAMLAQVPQQQQPGQPGQQQQQQQQPTLVGPVPIAVPAPIQSIQASASAPLPSHVGGSGLRLRIVEQPPERCVYKRNMKPNPVVTVDGDIDPDTLSTLKVAPLLIRCDLNGDETRHLSGGAPCEVPQSRAVPFRRLKVLVTSHQLEETMFVLRFELRRYRSLRSGSTHLARGPSPGAGTSPPPGGECYDVLHSVNTRPLCVVSHSTQLRPSPATPASVTEVVPALGPTVGGTRVAVLGRNFADTPNTRVRFDNVEVVPEFRGPGTLLCATPPHMPGVVEVRVCNARDEWSETSAAFAYSATAMSARMDAGCSERVLFPALCISAAGASSAQDADECDDADAVDLDSDCIGTASAQQQYDDAAGAGAAQLLDAAQGVPPMPSAGSTPGGASMAPQMREGSGNTPLHWASAAGNTQVVEFLLQHEADVDARNSEGETALHAAAAAGSAECCEALLRAGASAEVRGLDGIAPQHMSRTGLSPRGNGGVSRQMMLGTPEVGGGANGGQQLAGIDEGADGRVVDMITNRGQGGGNVGPYSPGIAPGGDGTDDYPSSPGSSAPMSLVPM
eukprot:m51a1_g11901 hypothetical protein (839) ;mRNA; r:616501-619650